MCNKTFKDESSLNQHLRDSFAHKQVIINNTFCPICEKRFNKPEDLQRHNSSPVHRDRNTPCVFTGCSSKFKTPSGLAQHVESSCERSPLSRHQITAAVQSLNIAPKFSLRSVEGSSFMPGTSRPLIGYQPLESSFNGYGYQCPICSKTFRALPSLEAHLNSAAHDEDEFKCPKCNTHFTLISGLVQHLESVSCGLSNITDVERRFAKMTEQFSRSLKF
ncbi:hypothetical protein M378DRAFT_13690 [Amanita muscaria Koide BX008]|uniref:C2H2-type domain-containing protein n=1 Tax=Amanita muscaria (strain Koide BX008) TaxID=946122 RepID=A0A0C2SDM4_AMAMK|nr:hypothetical protein M378DRAFT_13690 [Amanita muscaria Koide BX008]